MPQDWQKHLILSTQMAGQLCVVTPSHLEKNMILQSHFTKKRKNKNQTFFKILIGRGTVLLPNTK